MSDTTILEQFSLEELVAELKARETVEKLEERTLPSAFARAPIVDDRLRDVSSRAIAEFVIGQQRGIYGTDDRHDLFQVADPAVLADADTVVSLFDASAVVDNGDGTSTLRTQNFGTEMNLCHGEPFRSQPLGAFGSGFVVGSDLIATAGHCLRSGQLANIRFVFGFRMTDADTARTVINNGEIYRGVHVVAHQLTRDRTDHAVVRVDRPITNHHVARVRSDGRVADQEALHVIGHPCGLPIKYAPNAKVRDNAPGEFFVANLDTYGGNSGSPVFNSQTHEVEGILVRGEKDFVLNGGCHISLVCPNTGCRGEDCTRVTEFSVFLSVLYQLHNNGRIWRYVGPPTGWHELGNNPATVAIAADGDGLYQLHANGQIWRYTGAPLTGWELLDDNPETKQITAAGGNLFQIRNTGHIWRYTGTPLSGWQLIDDNPASATIVAEGDQLYQLERNGRLQRYTGTQLAEWELLNDNPATKQVVASGGRLYQLQENGRLLRYAGPPSGWEELNNDPATVAIAADGDRLYQMHSNGRIWRQHLGDRFTDWELLGDSPETKQIAAAGGNLFQIRNSGHILRYVGPPLSGWQLIGEDRTSVGIVAANAAS